MQKLLDKILLLALCLLAMSFAEIWWVSIVTMLVAIAVSSLCGYLENRYSAFLCVGYVILCLIFREFVIFLPLIVYDCAGLRHNRDNESLNRIKWAKWVLCFCWVAVLPIVFAQNTFQTAAVIALSSGVACLLQYRTNSQLKIRNELFALRDDAKEQAEHLELKNRSLMEKQDYEIRLATLAERNRIAREIHDNVGHILTRSLLQISALRVTHAGDEALSGELDMIKDSLSDAMDSVRSSVHDLHDESIDLRSRLEAMIDGFVFCPVKLRYDAGDLPVEVKLCFAAIVREALSNIAKHSGATGAAVSVMEHPSFYQLVVSDNGVGKAEGFSETGGIGLQSMAERVDALGGIFRTEQDKGFKVFISVPK